MKKQFLNLLALIGLVLMGGASSAWAQTAIGVTEAVDEANKKLAAREYTMTDNVTYKEIYGSNIKDYAGTSKNVYYNGTAYASTDSWRKSQNGVYDGQNVGYTLSVASGYAMTLSKIEARILNADDTYTWYAEILDATGTPIYKSAELTTTKASTAFLSDDLSLASLTGDVTVQIWVNQNGSTKYFSVERLIVDAVVAADSRTTYSVTTSATPEEGGTVSPSGTTDFVEGTDVTLTATPNTGYKFVNWTINGVTEAANPYTIAAIGQSYTAVANFEALPQITFTAGEDEGVQGTVPAVAYVEAGAQYTIPQSYFLAKDGCTLTGWNDGTNTYAVGESFTVSGDITLTPVFTPNTVAFGDADVTVNWVLAMNDGAPGLKCETTTSYYVQTVNINGTAIDAVMFIDATSGKIDNTAQQGVRAQVNGGTKFTIPAVKGMVVTYTYTNNGGGVTYNGGEAGETATDAKINTYTYTGDATTLEIADLGDNYPTGISVYYPAAQKSYTLTTADTDFYSLYLDYAAEIPEGVTAYTGTLNGDVLEVAAVEGNVIPAETAVLVKSAEAGEYVFNETAEEATVGDNDLLGVLVDTDANELSEDGKIVLALGVLDGKIGFRQPAGGVINANKVYLLVGEAAAAKGVSISFGGEATGISEVSAQQAEAAGVLYNLAGQRVAAGTKGLLIKNGKKYINK